MPQNALHILLIAPDGPETDGLSALVTGCLNPRIEVTSAIEIEAGSLLAASGTFDLVLLDLRAVKPLAGGLLSLSPALRSFPIVLSIAADQESSLGSLHPGSLHHYIVRDHDDSDVVKRVFRYAVQRYATLHSLQEAEERLRHIIEGISDGVLILGEDGHVLFANPAVESILELPLHEILWAPSGIDLPESTIGEVELLSHRHAPKQLAVSHGPIRWEGRDATLVTVRDITAQRDLEIQLRRAKEDAERVANLKTAFLANMSHELRMPLASIIGFAQLIREGLEQDEFREFADSIIQGGNRLLETITSVLDLTRLDANAVQTHVRLVEATPIAREAVGVLGALATQKQLELAVIAGEEDYTLRADPTLLRRILNNLIGNAIKFTDRGHVHVLIDRQDELVRIRVEDTGIGIGPAFLPQLFEEFTQESSGYDRSHEGSGLGLAITRKLCELMGASITVESEPGKGTTFTLTAPHADPESGPPYSLSTF